MPKCPKCGQETSHIICDTTEHYISDVRLPKDELEKTMVEYDADSGLIWTDLEDTIIIEDKYECPSCREVIVQDEEGVLRFLKGETIPESP